MTTDLPTDPAARVARWLRTDDAVGAAAEIDQLHATLAERDREIADLRARLGNLQQRSTQSAFQPPRASLVDQLRRPDLARRIARRAYRAVTGTRPA